MHPEQGGNRGHASLSGCGSLTGPLHRVQGVIGHTLVRTSHGRGAGPRRWLHPFRFFAHSKVWELGKMCHGRQLPVYLVLVLLLPLLL